MHIPAHRPVLNLHIVIGDGHDRDVVQQGLEHDHDRGERHEVVDEIDQHHDQHDVDGHGDAVIDIAGDALEDRAGFHDGVDDGRQARRGQDQGRCSPRRIRRPAHRHAAIGLLEGRGVVHAVSGHGHDVAALLQRLHDGELVLGEDAPEAIGHLHCAGGIDGDMLGALILAEHVARHQEPVAEPQLAGNLAANGHVVTGDHLHRDAQLLRPRNGGGGIGAGRIQHGQQAEQGPGRAVGRAGNAQRARAGAGEAFHRAEIFARRGAFGEAAQGGDGLRRALGHMEGLAVRPLERRRGLLVDRVEGGEVHRPIAR